MKRTTLTRVITTFSKPAALLAKTGFALALARATGTDAGWLQRGLPSRSFGQLLNKRSFGGSGCVSIAEILDAFYLDSFADTMEYFAAFSHSAPTLSAVFADPSTWSRCLATTLGSAASAWSAVTQIHFPSPRPVCYRQACHSFWGQFKRGRASDRSAGRASSSSYLQETPTSLSPQMVAIPNALFCYMHMHMHMHMHNNNKNMYMCMYNVCMCMHMYVVLTVEHCTESSLG